MKTPTLNRSWLGILGSGLLAAAALAGPGPQPGHSAPPPPEKAPRVKVDGHPTGKCEGCRMVPIWVISDRGPAGKGVPGARVTGYSHSCTGCVGKNRTENGKTTLGMQHGPACAALGCCK